MKFYEFENKTALFHHQYIGNGITWIQDMMGAGMYLIEGRNRAALIDTGDGIGNLKRYAEAITSKNIDVYLTHGHMDHAGGCFEFDTVFVPETEQKLLKWHTAPALRTDFLTCVNPAFAEIEDFQENLIYEQDKKFHDIRVGDRFDLGNRVLEVVDLKGHTAGSVGYYDHNTGALFAGDGCNDATWLFLRESLTVEEYFETMKALKKQWAPVIKEIYICHRVITAPVSVIDDLLTCCGNILENKVSGAEFDMPYKPFCTEKIFWADVPPEDPDKYKGNIIYSNSRILKA